MDDVNSRRHDPIGLDYFGNTKWWPHCQFTFLCYVSEVNALNSRVRVRRLPAESQLAFRQNLARGMLKNNLDSEGKFPGSPAHTRRRSSGSHVPDHELFTRPKFTGPFIFRQIPCSCEFWSSTKLMIRYRRPTRPPPSMIRTPWTFSITVLLIV